VCEILWPIRVLLLCYYLWYCCVYWLLTIVIGNWYLLILLFIDMTIIRWWLSWLFYSMMTIDNDDIIVNCDPYDIIVIIQSLYCCYLLCDYCVFYCVYYYDYCVLMLLLLYQYYSYWLILFDIIDIILCWYDIFVLFIEMTYCVLIIIIVLSVCCVSFVYWPGIIIHYDDLIRYYSDDIFISIDYSLSHSTFIVIFIFIVDYLSKLLC